MVNRLVQALTPRKQTSLHGFIQFICATVNYRKAWSRRLSKRRKQLAPTHVKSQAPKPILVSRFMQQCNGIYIVTERTELAQYVIESSQLASVNSW